LISDRLSVPSNSTEFVMRMKSKVLPCCRPPISNVRLAAALRFRLLAIVRLPAELPGEIVPVKPPVDSSKCQQELLDFLQPRLGLFAHQSRKFSAERDEIVISCEHQLVLLHFDDGHRLLARENLQFADEQQQFDRRRQQPEAVAQFI